MKLKTYIENLKKVITQNPNYAELDVIYAKDDEGNGYQHIAYGPRVGVNSEDGFYYAEFEYYDPDEHEEDEVNCVCVN